MYSSPAFLPNRKCTRGKVRALEGVPWMQCLAGRKRPSLLTVTSREGLGELNKHLRLIRFVEQRNQPSADPFLPG
jgi:hypothetical protein